MYKSPIELLIADIHHQIAKQQDEDIYQAVLHYIPNVDKEELIRALKYDRQQYEAGYLAGQSDAMASFVRCKDCKYASEDGYALRCDHPDLDWELECFDHWLNRNHDDFCSQGERREADV